MDTTTAREQARRPDGKFGEQAHDRATSIDLSDTGWMANSDDGDAAIDDQQDQHPGFAVTGEHSFTQQANIDSGRPAWGAVNEVYPVATGITEVSCAGHGGIKLSPERNRLVPKELRRPGGWYEEDCEYKIVVATFPREFTEDSSHTYWSTMTPAEAEQEALKSVRQYWPDEYETITGQAVPASDSTVIAGREFRASHHGDFLVDSVHDTDFDSGVVTLRTSRPSDGQKRFFRMSLEEYRRRQRELPSGIYSVPISPGDAEVADDVAAAEDQAAKARRLVAEARFAERSERARGRFWTNTDRLTDRERAKLRDWESERVRTSSGAVLTRAELFEREPVHNVQRIVDGTRVKWYAGLLGTVEDGDYIREIPAVAAKAAEVPHETDASTFRWIEEDRAAKRAARQRRERERKLFGRW